MGGAILGRIWPSVMQFAGVVALAEAAEPAALSRSGVSAGAWVRMARSVLPASSAPAIMTRSTAARAATRRNTIRTLERRSSHEGPQALVRVEYPSVRIRGTGDTRRLSDPGRRLAQGHTGFAGGEGER